MRLQKKNLFLCSKCLTVRSGWRHKHNSIHVGQFRKEKVGITARDACWCSESKATWFIDWISLSCTVACRHNLWPVCIWTVMLPRPSLAHGIRQPLRMFCLYSGVSRSLSTLVAVPLQKGWKMLALCFIWLSGSDVSPPGDAKHWLDFNPSPLRSASSLFFFPCCTRAVRSGRLSEVSSSTPAATPALIEPLRYEVMTESCPKPLSLDLQLKWSQLNGRVH